MKKSISILLSIVLILMTFTPTLAASEDDFYNQAGEILGSVKVLQGNASGDLMLNNYLNRQDMVVLVSRLFKEESTARNSSPKVPFKDVTDNFYKPYISWSVNKGLIVGKTETKFGFDETVTVKQLQTVLLRALGYNEEAKDWDNVPTFAKSLGLMENINAEPSNTVMRGLMAGMTVNALRLNKKGTSTTLAQSLNLTIPDPFTVESVFSVSRDVLKVEGMAVGAKTLQLHLKPVSKSITTGEKLIDVPLQSDGRFVVEVKNLESGDYSYAFTNGIYYTKYENFTVKELPLELVNVSAENLKEIKLTFTKAIDKSTALFASNYYTDAGNIKKVRLEDGDRQVVLTLDSTMVNQRKYKLSISRIKALNGEEISLDNIEFEAFDNQIPTVVDIKQLGNKIIKVYFSEPIKPASNSNFLIDGRRFSGSVRNDDHIVYLNFYTPLNEGIYTLTTNQIEDYANYRAVEERTDFQIVKDSEPPKIVDARATIEEVILTFDEEIDPSTATKSNFYWRYGSMNRYPKNVTVSGEEVILDFSNNPLSPSVETYIYVNGVIDYSGNKLKNFETKVVPTIDLNPPEVVSIRVSADGKEITVYYNKNVVGNNKNFYTIKDKDNRPVSIRDITGSGREYKLMLFQPLPVGTNTLTIQGVYDTTTLKNKINVYTKTIDMKDLTPPRITSHSGKDTQIILQFSKPMDVGTLENPDNYIIKFGNLRNYLPTETGFLTLNDGKMLIIELPRTIDGKDVRVGTSGNLTELQVTGLKDLSGNLISPEVLTFSSATTLRSKAIDYYDSKPGYQGVLVSENEIKIKFDQPIVDARPEDFNISGRVISDIAVDNSEVITLYLYESDNTAPPTSLSIKSNNNMVTMIELDVQGGSINVLDEVSPIVKEFRQVSSYKYEMTFTESLDSRLESSFAQDLLVLSNGQPTSRFSTKLKTGDPSTIVITVDENIKPISIEIVHNPKFITDKSGNPTISSGPYYSEW